MNKLQHFDAGVRHPLYSGDMSDIVEVGMRQTVVTHARDAKPVLATFGLDPCVAVVGYEPNQNVGFMTHYIAGIDVPESFLRLYGAFHRVGIMLNSQTHFEVRLVGGWPGCSEDLIAALKHRIAENAFNMKVVEEDAPGYTSFWERNIALDTKTGQTFSYDPKLNPHRPPQSEIEREIEILRSLFPEPADVVYCAQRLPNMEDRP